MPDGPGDSPNNPVSVDDFFDPLGSALIWKTPETGQRENEWERENEFEVTPDLHCRWVRISGHFRRDNYQHYRGVLADSSSSLYTEKGGPGNKIRQRRYIIENWSDPDIQSALINGADIQVLGQFYDLCRIAYEEREKAKDGRIIMSGPCHYGRFTGLMLRDVVVEAVLSAPFQRVRGEENRSVIGTIREIDDSWRELSAVREKLIEKLNKIRKGPKQYWTEALANVEPNEDEIAKLSSDHDNWISFLALDPLSPLHPSKRPIEKNEFRAFRLSKYGGGESEDQINIAIACFCTQRVCKNQWPLFWEDATDFHDQYLCFTFYRQYPDRTKWR